MFDKRIENLKYKIIRIITARLKQPDLSCDDILKLSRATAALERNDIYKAVIQTGVINETDI